MTFAAHRQIFGRRAPLQRRAQLASAGSINSQAANDRSIDFLAVNQTDKEGKSIMLFGRNPKGTQIFDATGHWMQIIWDSDVPKYQVNSRIGGTPEENTAAVRGTTATFGAWSVDEANRTLAVRFTGSLFPNQAGTESRCVVSVAGDQLKIINPVTVGGVRSDTVWLRAK